MFSQSWKYLWYCTVPENIFMLSQGHIAIHSTVPIKKMHNAAIPSTAEWNFLLFVKGHKDLIDLDHVTAV